MEAQFIKLDNLRERGSFHKYASTSAVSDHNQIHSVHNGEWT